MRTGFGKVLPSFVNKSIFTPIAVDAMKKEEWFKTWFDSPYYQILYENRNEKEAEQFLNKLLQYLSLPTKSAVLDAGCGKGRYSVFLADRGFNVVGIDLSWVNIQEALMAERDNLTFLLHDMRNLFYINYFDVAFNIFTSFGYFNSEKDNQRTMASLSLSLRKGGRMVIDFFNSERVMSELVPEQHITREGIGFNIKKYVQPATNGSEQPFIVKKIIVNDHNKIVEFEERVQALRLKNFSEYFAAHGLQIKDVFGDYRLQPFDEKKSERLILIAEKI